MTKINKFNRWIAKITLGKEFNNVPDEDKGELASANATWYLLMIVVFAIPEITANLFFSHLSAVFVLVLGQLAFFVLASLYFRHSLKKDHNMIFQYLINAALGMMIQCFLPLILDKIIEHLPF